MKKLFLSIIILHSAFIHADTKHTAAQKEINSVLYQQLHGNIVLLSELRNKLIENKEYVPPVIDLLIMNNLQIMYETELKYGDNEQNIYLKIASCYAGDTNKRQELAIGNNSSNSTEKELPLNTRLKNQLNSYGNEAWCLRLSNHSE